MRSAELTNDGLIAAQYNVLRLAKKIYCDWGSIPTTDALLLWAALHNAVRKLAMVEAEMQFNQPEESTTE